MKAIILQYMSDLIESEDAEEKTRLRDQLTDLIALAKFDLDDKKATHTKKLIIATITSYVQGSDPALKQALLEHSLTLNRLLFNYC